MRGDSQSVTEHHSRNRHPGSQREGDSGRSPLTPCCVTPPTRQGGQRCTCPVATRRPASLRSGRWPERAAPAPAGAGTIARRRPRQGPSGRESETRMTRRGRGQGQEHCCGRGRCSTSGNREAAAGKGRGFCPRDPSTRQLSAPPPHRPWIPRATRRGRGAPPSSSGCAWSQEKGGGQSSGRHRAADFCGAAAPAGAVSPDCAHARGPRPPPRQPHG